MNDKRKALVRELAQSLKAYRFVTDDDADIANAMLIIFAAAVVGTSVESLCLHTGRTWSGSK